MTGDYYPMTVSTTTGQTVSTTTGQIGYVGYAATGGMYYYPTVTYPYYGPEPVQQPNSIPNQPVYYPPYGFGTFPVIAEPLPKKKIEVEFEEPKEDKPIRGILFD